MTRWLAPLLSIAVYATGVGSPAHADNSRQTVEWQPFDDKDPLTDKVTHRVAGQVNFSDGNVVQVFAKCAEVATGGPYPA